MFCQILTSGVNGNLSILSGLIKVSNRRQCFSVCKISSTGRKNRSKTKRLTTKISNLIRTSATKFPLTKSAKKSVRLKRLIRKSWKSQFNHLMVKVWLMWIQSNLKEFWKEDRNGLRLIMPFLGLLQQLSAKK